MKSLHYVYQNYRQVHSSASLSILRGFQKNQNIQVESFEFKPISYSHSINRVINRATLIRNLHFRKQNNLLLKELNKQSCDYLFVMKGTDLSYGTLKQIKEQHPSMKLICFNPDDPFNLSSSNDNILASIKLYDVYCIWTEFLNQKLLDVGANNVVYFPFGIDEEIIYPIETETEYDISFIGNGDAERHQLIIEFASELKKSGLNLRIDIFGSNWPYLGKNVIVHGQRMGKQLLKTIASSKINLNLLRKQNKNSINMRTFEIPAAGGFMLHEESSEAKNFFTPNEEAVYFSNAKEMVDLCEAYLNDEVGRKSVIFNSLKKINRGSYSYKNIIEDFLLKLAEF